MVSNDKLYQRLVNVSEKGGGESGLIVPNPGDNGCHDSGSTMMNEG